MNITDDTEQIERIEFAMNTCEGNHTLAADALQVHKALLLRTIRETPALAKWKPGGVAKKKKAVMEVEIPPPAIPTHQALMAQNESLMQMIQQEDAMLRLGLDRMGLTPDQIDEALSYSKFQTAHSAQALHIMGGGMTKNGIRVGSAMNKVYEALSDPNQTYYKDTYTADGKLAMNGNEIAGRMLLAMSEEFRKIHGAILEASIARAKMEVWKRKKEQNPGGGGGSGGTKFGPLRANVLAQPGSTVHLHGNSNGDEQHRQTQHTAPAQISGGNAPAHEEGGEPPE